MEVLRGGPLRSLAGGQQGSAPVRGAVLRTGQPQEHWRTEAALQEALLGRSGAWPAGGALERTIQTRLLIRPQVEGERGRKEDSGTIAQDPWRVTMEDKSQKRRTQG